MDTDRVVRNINQLREDVVELKLLHERLMDANAHRNEMLSTLIDEARDHQRRVREMLRHIAFQDDDHADWWKNA